MLAWLSRDFDVSGTPCGHADALAARADDADIVVLDADLTDTDRAEIVAGIVLVCAAPLIALTADAAISKALFVAGASAVTHKPAGRLPLDLSDGFGDTVTATIGQLP